LSSLHSTFQINMLFYGELKIISIVSTYDISI
jgi:hypothetical protein